MKLLRGVPFLKDLGDNDMNKLANAMTPKRIEKGEYLMRKGDKGDNFYIFGLRVLGAFSFVLMDLVDSCRCPHCDCEARSEHGLHL